MAKVKRKPRIGIIVGNYHSDHARRLVKNLYELAKKADVNAHFYLGTESSSFLKEFAMQSNRYDYQYASLYSVSNYSDLDLLIVSVGTLTIFQKAMTPERFLQSLPDVPMILTETRIKPKKGAYLIADNYNGMHSLVEHLIKVHNLTKVAYLGGPKTGNLDAAERLAAYLDVMKEHGREINDDLIRYGDFSEHVDELAEELLDLNPDLEAIVCANDEMAIAVYRVCAKRGLVVGHDIAVTGFDDMELASFMNPPLTTVKQDYDAMSKKAMEKALAILRGEKVESEEIVSPLIRRSSCCCPNTDPKMADALFRYSERRDLISNVWKNHDRAHHSWVGPLLTRELLLENFSKKDFYDRLGNCFYMIGAKSAVIGTFETPRVVEEGDFPDAPDYMLLHLYQRGDQWWAYDGPETPKIYLRSLKPDAPDDTSGLLTFFLLFYENTQYGIMWVEIEPEDIEFYYTLSMEIGTALRNLSLSMAQQQYQNMLQNVARHDNLTGLYNRFGFMNAASDYGKEHLDQTMVTMMADLDHLKQINDGFGHMEGDFAIRKCAEILREAIGEKGLLGRTGGDEFMGMFSIKNEKELEKIKKKIKKISDDFNKVSDKPYYVELSIGCVTYKYEDTDNFNDLIRQADESLYEAKKVRRQSVVK